MASRFGKEFLSDTNPGEPATEKVLAAYKGKWNISPDEYRRRVEEQKEREKHVPKIGEAGPDFALERLAPAGERTGTNFKLSSARGKPLAVAFGSYT